MNLRNYKKTSVNTTMKESKLEDVLDCKYLGSTFAKDGRSTTEF